MNEEFNLYQRLYRYFFMNNVDTLNIYLKKFGVLKFNSANGSFLNLAFFSFTVLSQMSLLLFTVRLRGYL